MGEATRVSLYDNTFTVAKLQSITNSLGYIDTNKGIIKASRESVVSAKDIQDIKDRKRASKRVTVGQPIRSQ